MVVGRQREKEREREGACSSLPREKVKAKAVCFEDEMRHRVPIIPAFDRLENHSSPNSGLVIAISFFFKAIHVRFPLQIR